MVPPIHPDDLAAATGDYAAAASRPEPDSTDPVPAWGTIIFWSIMALVAVPGFLTWCGSIRL